MGQFAVKDVGLFVSRQGLVLVDEADPGVELGVAAETLLDAGHADAGAVVMIAELFEAGGLEPVC